MCDVKNKSVLTTLGASIICGLLFVLLLVGCGDEEEKPYLELGTGLSSLEVVEPNQRLPLVSGSQGGVHIWLSFCVFGLDSSKPFTFEISSTLLDGSQQPQRSRITFMFEEKSDDCPAGVYGWPAVVANPACFVEKELQIEVRVFDKTGKVAENSMTIVPFSEEVLPPCEDG